VQEADSPRVFEAMTDCERELRLFPFVGNIVESVVLVLLVFVAWR